MPSYALRFIPKSFAKLNVLVRYIIVVSFISGALAVVKLKNFICFCDDAASMKWHLLGFFGPFLRKILLDLAESFGRRNPLSDKHIFWGSFKNFDFFLKKDVTKIYRIGPFLGLIYPRKITNNAKNQNFSKMCIVRNIK